MVKNKIEMKKVGISATFLCSCAGFDMMEVSIKSFNNKREFSCAEERVRLIETSLSPQTHIL